MEMRHQILDSMRMYCHGNIQKHKANVEVYLANPVGIGEHPDVMEAIESELGKIAEYEDLIEVLDKHFTR